ncbi:hypothetical protein FTUN_4328 [Frigoriglobus tundricola]|uniref:Uncharacterized protein n=1 Tax=Frigoriglobus tundricola TaxID=2774151 RepID=A0A6M5YSA5_9BACT|nr:hypothetical protein FTUN_4328 [Frigoriglobus tundricola]
MSPRDAGRERTTRSRPASRGDTPGAFPESSVRSASGVPGVGVQEMGEGVGYPWHYDAVRACVALGVS